MEEHVREVIDCTRCSLSRSRLKLPGHGPTKAGVMVVSSFPTRGACRHRRHFASSRGGTSASGRLLDSALRKALGVGLDDVYITSLIKCPLPPRSGRLRSELLEDCWFHLETELRSVRPKAIITLGNDASHELIPGFRQIGLHRGRPTIRLDGSVVVPTYHPSYAVRFGRRREVEEDLAMLASSMRAAWPSGQV